MAKSDYKAPYGWLHSCGELYYQLDHPVECKCLEDGHWEWYEKEVDSDRKDKKVH